MLVYTVATLISVFFCIAYQKQLNISGDISNSLKENYLLKALLFLSGLPLFLISALRIDTGTDTWHTYTPEFYALRFSMTGIISPTEQQYLIDSYMRQYPDAIHATYEEILDYFIYWSDHSSVLFQWLQKGLIYLNVDVQWLYVITSAFIISLIFRAIYRQSSSVAMAVFLFVTTSNYFLTINIVAQSMAIALMLVACEYAEKRKPISFLLLILLAIGFHSSAFVVLVIYILPRLNIKPLWCCLSIIACLFMTPILLVLVRKLVTTFVPKYARYFGETTDFEIIFFAIGICVFLLTSYYFKQCKDLPYFKLWYYMNVLGLLALCFSAYIPNMKRINYYFAAPHFLLLPLIINAEENKKTKWLLCIGILVAFTLETIIAVGYMNKNGALPYQHCL